MAVVSRLQLNHPALGTTGGASLHTAIEALYTKLGDAMADRYFALTDFDNGETVDLLHNFDTDIANLRYDLYNYTGGQWVEVTTTSSPALSAFTIIEKVGFEDTTLQITNVSGGNDLEMAVVLVNDPIRLLGNDIKDIDNTTPIEDGQSLVYDSLTSKLKPGASGDSSFKVQSVTTPNAVIKGGFLIDDAGKELATYNGSLYGADITANLTTILGSSPADATTYYLYVDRLALAASVVESGTGRTLYAVAQAQLYLSTLTPLAIDRSRYYPIDLIRSATTGNAWSGSGSTFKNLAVRRHQTPSVNVSPMVQTILEERSLGEVGCSDDGYGALVAASFPNSTTLHIYNGNQPTGTQIDDSVGTAHLLGTGTPIFNSKGFYGRENVCQLNGTSQYFSAAHADFGYATASNTMSFGGWLYDQDWGNPDGNQAYISLGNTTDAAAILVQKDSNGASAVIRVVPFNNATGMPTFKSSSLTPGWHQFVIVLNGTSMKVYIDGQLASSTTITSGTTSSGIVIGAHSSGASQFSSIIPQDLFFHKGTVLTDSQVLDLYSKRFSGAQVSAGHHLDADSFPLTSLTNKVSFWNLDSATDGTAQNSLTNTGSVLFTGLGLFGAANAATFDADGKRLQVDSSNAVFGAVGSSDKFAFGAWVKFDRWGTGGSPQQHILSLASGAGSFVAIEQENNSLWVMDGANYYGFTNGALNGSTQVFPTGVWFHLAIRHNGAKNFSTYLNGILQATFTVAGGTYPTSPSSFTIGQQRNSVSSTFAFRGTVSNAFFTRHVELSDADFLKLCAARLDLVGASANVRLADRILSAKFQSEDGKTYNDFDQSWLLDQKSNKVYCNFGQGDAKVTLKCFDGGLNASVLPIKTYDVTFTATPGATIAHGLPAMPTSISILHNESADGKYVSLSPEDYVKADATNIYTTNFGSLTIDATHQLRIVASVGEVAAAFARDFSENLSPVKVVKTTTYTASVGDHILADTTSAPFTITLPLNPSVGQEVNLYDFAQTWGTNNLTLDRNGQSIDGAASNLVLNLSGSKAKIVFAGGSQGWRYFS